jgi:hypothetical protein
MPRDVCSCCRIRIKRLCRGCSAECGGAEPMFRVCAHHQSPLYALRTLTGGTFPMVRETERGRHGGSEETGSLAGGTGKAPRERPDGARVLVCAHGGTTTPRRSAKPKSGLARPGGGFVRALPPAPVGSGGSSTRTSGSGGGRLHRWERSEGSRALPLRRARTLASMSSVGGVCRLRPAVDAGATVYRDAGRSAGVIANLFCNAPAMCRKSGSFAQCFRRSLIAALSPGLGSTSFSVTCRSSHSRRCSIVGPLCRWWNCSRHSGDCC